MYIHTHTTESLCCTTETNNIVSQLYFSQKKKNWASLVGQWLRICCIMQGTQVPDSTRCRAAKPVCHSYWAHVPCSPCSTRRSLHTTMKSSPGSPQLEKARVRQRRPTPAKNETNLFLKKENTFLNPHSLRSSISGSGMQLSNLHFSSVPLVILIYLEYNFLKNRQI